MTSCAEVWYSVPVSQLSVGQGNEVDWGYVYKTELSKHSPSLWVEDQCPTKVGDVILVRKRENTVRQKKTEGFISLSLTSWG